MKKLVVVSQSVPESVCDQIKTQIETNCAYSSVDAVSLCDALLDTGLGAVDRPTKMKALFFTQILDQVFENFPALDRDAVVICTEVPE